MHLFYKTVRAALLSLPSSLPGCTVTQSTSDDCVFVVRHGTLYLLDEGADAR
jgi:hypothetical protein